MVKPALDALEGLSPRIVIDRSNAARSGIRIVLKPREDPQQILLPLDLKPLPPAVTLQVDGNDVIRDLEYVIVDLETTGGAPYRGHRVTEVAAVRMRGDGQIVDEFETLLNPDRYIPPFITQLTKISPAMVENAPRFADVARDVQRILHGAVFVAHNAQFDHGFLGMELGRCGLPLEGRTLCTVRLARKTVPEVQSRSLDSLMYFFGVDNAARHRAMGDARATALIFRRLLDRLEDHEVTRWNDLETFLRRRARRTRKRIANPHPMPDA